jgi:ArsR family transcriptional regulator
MLHTLKRATRKKPSSVDFEILEQQVRICKAFANTTRLQMLDLLGERECSVTELQRKLTVSKTNLSQHLAILKSAGIVRTRRDGRHIYCSLAIPAVRQACHLIREVLREQLKRRQALTF